MSVIKTKLRNRLAIPMVEAILTTRLGLKRRGESCATFKVLPGMMENFNYNMYDHVRAAAVPRPRNERQADEQEEEGGEAEDLIEILNDVEELLGEPVLLTP